MTDTYIQFYAFPHLVGQKVAAFVGGLDCGDYVVAVDGSVIVPFGSDDGGLMTATYLSGLDGYEGENAAQVYFDDGSGADWYTVPVVIGMAYNADGQCLRPATADDLNSPTGPGLAKLRRVNQIGVLLNNTQTAVTVGVDFSLDMVPLPLTDTDRITELDATEMFSGVLQQTINGEHDFNGMVAWRAARPGPFSVVALTTFLHGSEG